MSITKIPKYVQELMSRSHYVYDREKNSPEYAAGYTIAISKATTRTQVDTLCKEVERLCRWADREAGCKTAHILSVPERTHYVRQSAVVTIYDPIMQHIEQYIKA